jgi:tRNA dimethylallyltransferase
VSTEKILPLKNNTLIVLLGPTGVGKTDLSIRLAQLLETDIISADSRQLYAELKIGTAAPTAEQQALVKHHFVGILQLHDYYSAAQYESEVMQLLESLFAHKRTALLTGGSMMYIDAVCKGIDDIPTIPAEVRDLMHQRYETEGLDSLCAELKLRDPEYYRQVDLKNPKRIIHALEICYTSKTTYSSLRTRPQKEHPFQIVKIGLKRDREELYNRINTRVDEMMSNGLLEEVKRVYPYRSENSLNTVGYQELFNYLDGVWTLPFAVEKIKQNTRIYSRKQTTWFKRDESIHWFHPSQEKEIIEFVKNAIQ